MRENRPLDAGEWSRRDNFYLSGLPTIGKIVSIC